MRKFKQYKTSVNLNIDRLSDEQKEIRKDIIKVNGDFKCCKTCSEIKLINNFRVRKTKHNDNYVDATCKDCHARVRGTKEIGKLHFSKHILNKGFRKCCECKEIKVLSEYSNNAKRLIKKNYICRGCAYTKNVTIKSNIKGVTKRQQGRYIYWKSSVWHNGKHNLAGLFPFTKEGKIMAKKAYDELKLKLSLNIGGEGFKTCT